MAKYQSVLVLCFGFRPKLNLSQISAIRADPSHGRIDPKPKLRLELELEFFMLFLRCHFRFCSTSGPGGLLVNIR